MNEQQHLATRLGRLAERVAILETMINQAGQGPLVSADLTIVAGDALILEYAEIGNGYGLEVADGGALLLIG